MAALTAEHFVLAQNHLCLSGTNYGCGEKLCRSSEVVPRVFAASANLISHRKHLIAVPQDILVT